VWILKRAAQSPWKLPKGSVVPVPDPSDHLTRTAVRAGHGLEAPSLTLDLPPSPVNPSPQDLDGTPPEGNSARLAQEKIIVKKGCVAPIHCLGRCQ